jgi:hypothetical protein
VTSTPRHAVIERSSIQSAAFHFSWLVKPCVLSTLGCCGTPMSAVRWSELPLHDDAGQRGTDDAGQRRILGAGQGAGGGGGLGAGNAAVGDCSSAAGCRTGILVLCIIDGEIVDDVQLAGFQRTATRPPTRSK